MRALLKSGPARRRDPVQLAVHWNRCDEVVEDHLSSGSAGAQFPPKGGGKKESKIETFAEKIAGFDINEKENIKALVTQVILFSAISSHLNRVKQKFHLILTSKLFKFQGFLTFTIWSEKTLQMIRHLDDSRDDCF